MTDTDGSAHDAIAERLLRLGVSPDEVAAAERRGGLSSLAIEAMVAPARGLTVAEVAAGAGAQVADAVRLWRAWGFPEPEPDDRRFSARDVEMVRFALALEPLVGEAAAFHTARVMGVALARVAEAEVAMLRSTVEAPLRAAGASEDDVLASYEALIGMMLDTADDTLAILHRHQIVETVRRQLSWSVEASPHNVVDIVVGFADLTGSTRLATALALDELDHALACFEEWTADIVADAGASLVKRIGDAVMFTTPAVDVAARVASDLVARFADHPTIPPVRVGLAAGSVVARRGDFHGLPVVLAARLQTIAAPSTVLVDEAVAQRLTEADAPWSVEPAGAPVLAGFTEPVAAFRLAGGASATRATTPAPPNEPTPRRRAR